MASRFLPFVSSFLVVASLAFGASSASAAVQVDPHGPAGQQYALPLDSVRGESAGNPSAGVPGAATPPPLFGEGIRPEAGTGDPNGSDGKEADSGGTNNLDGGPGGSGGSGAFDAGKPEVSPNVKALISGTGGGSSSTFEMVLLIGGMALVGLTAGLIGRRTL